MGELTDYLDGLSGPDREALARIVTIAREVAPGTQEGRSYGMAALKLDGRPLLGVVAAKKHLSVFPFSPAVVSAVAEDLGGFSISKGTIRFTADRPLPEAVLRRIVELRLAELSAR